MKKTTTVTWKTADGKTLEATINYTKEMQNVVAYMDGWNLETGKKELYESLEIIVTLDGKYIDKASFEPSIIEGICYSHKMWDKVKAQGGYAKLGDKVILKKESYELMMAAIAEAKTEDVEDQEIAQFEAKKAAKETARLAKVEEMKQVNIPLYAIEAYNQYDGSSEKAWEDEDETAWALIKKWAPYIEEQRGAHPEQIKELWNEVNREANFGIQD